MHKKHGLLQKVQSVLCIWFVIKHRILDLFLQCCPLGSPCSWITVFWMNCSITKIKGSSQPVDPIILEKAKLGSRSRTGGKSGMLVYDQSFFPFCKLPSTWSVQVRGRPLITCGEGWWRFLPDQFFFLGEPPVSIFFYWRASGFNFFLGNLLFQFFPGDLPNQFFCDFHHAPPQMINGRPLRDSVAGCSTL